jgi:hypothetical protein
MNSIYGIIKLRSQFNTVSNEKKTRKQKYLA